MNTPLFTPQELACRWALKPTTLRHWRWSGKGPHYMKIGRRIFYRTVDVEFFEKNKRQRSSFFSHKQMSS